MVQALPPLSPHGGQFVLSGLGRGIESEDSIAGGKGLLLIQK